MRKELFVVFAVVVLFSIGFVSAQENSANFTGSDTCADDVKICENGTIFERDPALGCEFPSCPEELVLDECALEGEMCGGIAGFECCSDLECKLEGDYPDASGVCVEAPAFECVDTCGNSVCDEVVCQGPGCPCAETVESCPSDCSLVEEDSEGISYGWIFIGIFVVVALIIVGLKIAKWLVWAAVIAAVIFVLLWIFVL